MTFRLYSIVDGIKDHDHYLSLHDQDHNHEEKEMDGWMGGWMEKDHDYYDLDSLIKNNILIIRTLRPERKFETFLIGRLKFPRLLHCKMNLSTRTTANQKRALCYCYNKNLIIEVFDEIAAINKMIRSL